MPVDKTYFSCSRNSTLKWYKSDVFSWESRYNLAPRCSNLPKTQTTGCVGFKVLSVWGISLWSQTATWKQITLPTVILYINVKTKKKNLFTDFFFFLSILCKYLVFSERIRAAFCIVKTSLKLCHFLYVHWIKNMWMKFTLMFVYFLYSRESSNFSMVKGEHHLN